MRPGRGCPEAADSRSSRNAGDRRTEDTRSSENPGGRCVGFRLLIFTDDKQSGNPRRGVDMSDDDGPAGSQPHIM